MFSCDQTIRAPLSSCSFFSAYGREEKRVVGLRLATKNRDRIGDIFASREIKGSGNRETE